MASRRCRAHGAGPDALTLQRLRARRRRSRRRTWHGSTRPADLELDDGIEWLRLHIVDTEDGGPDDDTGVVEFVARYRDPAGPGTLRERSEFVRDEGHWLYTRAVTS